MKGTLPAACPKHPHSPLSKDNKKCVNCEGERLAERDRKSSAREPWAPWSEVVRGGRSGFKEKDERAGKVAAKLTGRY
jgi:hypothetical protein